MLNEYKLVDETIIPTKPAIMRHSGNKEKKGFNSVWGGREGFPDQEGTGFQIRWLIRSFSGRSEQPRGEGPESEIRLLLPFRTVGVLEPRTDLEQS